MPARQQIQHQVSRIGHLSKLPGPGCGGQIYWIADMVQKLLILKWTIVVDDIKHTSKDDKVDLPHPLVPHKSIVTDSFLSLILIRTVGKEKKGNVTKKETLSITFRLLWNGCDKLLRVKYIDSVTTNIFDLNKECQTCMEIDVMDMCIKWTDKYS